jgi:putative RNA 2'-phosphotransferase
MKPSDPQRQRELVKVSKGLAFVLRHRAREFGLLLDPEGFAPIGDVIVALDKAGISADEITVREAATTIEPVKNRYSIVEDAIRANYGHSLDREIAHPAVVPPALLLHGTHEAARDAILRAGLLPMQRQYVHLTDDDSLARQVGARRGPPCLLAIDAVAAHADGVVFLQANAHFWLAKHVPAQFVRTLA